MMSICIIWKSNYRGVVKKQGVPNLDAYDALLASNQTYSEKLEAITKKMEVQEVARLSTNGVICGFCVQAYESGAYLPKSLRLSITP